MVTHPYLDHRTAAVASGCKPCPAPSLALPSQAAELSGYAVHVPRTYYDFSFSLALDETPS